MAIFPGPPAGDVWFVDGVVKKGDSLSEIPPAFYRLSL
jgi:hypothetical protein